MSDLLGRLTNPLKSKPQELAPKLYKYKTRFSFLGTVGSGKTTVAGGIVLTAQTLSSLLPEFKCRILEGSSGVRVAASNLRDGRFPPKTPANLPAPAEAGLLLYWGGLLREKKVQIPVCDVSGEQVQQAIQKHGTQMYPTAEAYSQLSQLQRYVYDADGFIIALPSSRALIFADGARLEKEPTGIANDPDVNLPRILDSVFEYKERSGGKKIKGIAVVITKWDLMQPFAQKMNMDIQSAEGLQNFMTAAFPDTMMSLKAYGLDNVRFFPSYFKVKRDSKGNVEKWSDGTDRIEKHESILRMPKYPEKSYVNLFEYLKSFAT